MLIDTHCHLDFPDLREQLENVLTRANEAGVQRLISISTRIARFDNLLALTEKYESIFCTVGTHPHHSNEDQERTVKIEDIIRLSQSSKVVGIGEAGLDYHYDYSPREVQEASFRRHIAAARETGLPIVVHARSADKDIGNILEDEMRQGAFSGVLHCYSSGPELARRGLELGLYLSFSGIVTFKNAKEIQEIARAVPNDRLLIETDAPYLSPMPHRGKTNEPAYVAHTAAYLAGLRGMDIAALATLTTTNAHRLFSRLNNVA